MYIIIIIIIIIITAYANRSKADIYGHIRVHPVSPVASRLN